MARNRQCTNIQTGPLLGGHSKFCRDYQQFFLAFRKRQAMCAYYSPVIYSLIDHRGDMAQYGTTVEACPDTIDEVLKARNMGETVHEGCSPSSLPPNGQSLSDMIASDDCTAAALHLACFVGFLALKSGSATIEEVLGDTGLIHEMVHRMCSVDEEDDYPFIESQEELADMAHRIERTIPGYPFTPTMYRP